MITNFVRVAAVTPKIRVADCTYNAAQIIEAIKKADKQKIRLICMPEMCITGATCGDLVYQGALLEAAKNALFEIAEQTAGSDLAAVLGLPLLLDGKVKSSFAVICKGKILGVGTDIIYSCKEFPFSIGNAAAGADIVVTPSATPEIVGAAERRRLMSAAVSAQYKCACIVAEAGEGESTTDKVFAGHNLICENGKILAEAVPFSGGFAVSEIDITAIKYERGREESFALEGFSHVYFQLDNAEDDPKFRQISPTPFLPDNDITTRCEEILNIQSHGLKKRLEHIGARSVLGVSGGLDSTLALLIAVRANSEITAVTMPCFGTTDRTKSNAHKLCEALDIPCREIDITAQVTQHLADISHPLDQHDTTYENAQARIRTLVLMNIANQENGIVVGSGNLSELALGWATYNGDHMSMYAVNAGLPKTLVRHLVKYIAESTDNAALKAVLTDILATPISPELLPPKPDGEIIQQTEEIVGPYELHDFFLYHTLRWGRTPSQVRGLAIIAFDGIYSAGEIDKWQQTFYRRFFSQQFKRNCLPDAPQIGKVSLSPRGGWSMPSDAVGSVWR